MADSGIRWKQRFSNYLKTLAQLHKFVVKDGLSDMEEQGMIKSFEYTYELGWNTIKDFYEFQSEAGIQGSRDAIQLAFRRGLISDGETWMEMLKDRNRTTHTYNEDTAKEIVASIKSRYFTAFAKLQNRLEEL